MSDLLPKLPDNIEYADHALTDLKEIWFHIAIDNEDAANNVIIDIIKTLENISSFPNIGTTRDDLLLSLRSFPSGKYVIFYQKTDEGIEIVRVIHGARDIPQVLEEKPPSDSVN